MTAIAIPEEIEDNEAQQKFLYRAIEKMRLLHNEQPDEGGRKKCCAAQAKLFAQLNEIRDCSSPHEPDSDEDNALQAIRIKVKEDGKKMVEHDAKIDAEVLAGVTAIKVVDVKVIK